MRAVLYPFPCLKPLTLEKPSNTELKLWPVSCAERNKLYTGKIIQVTAHPQPGSINDRKIRLIQNL